MMLILRMAGQPDLQIECVIDTGFAGYLTLPPAAVSLLRLPFFYPLPASLADGSQVWTDVHTATAVWHDVERDIEVVAVGNRPLIGRAILAECSLYIDFREGGEVRIEQRP